MGKQIFLKKTFLSNEKEVRPEDAVEIK